MAITEGTGHYTPSDPGSTTRGSGIYVLDNYEYLQNRLPHRYLAAPTPWGGRIHRGVIQAHSQEFKGTLPYGTFAFHFNPERINLSYSKSPIDPLAEQAAAAEGVPAGMLIGAYQVSFVLLLNRQYDVAADPQGSRGTLHDVDTLLGLLGYGDYLVDRPVRVIFSPQFSFNGRVTNLNVTHHQFSHRMIPVWTTIDISMTNVPEGFMSGGTADAGGGVVGGGTYSPSNLVNAAGDPTSGRLA